MSLFSKLASGSGRQKSTDLAVNVGPGTWTAALCKQDSGYLTVAIAGPHALEQEWIDKGALCRVILGEERSFIVSVHNETMRAGQASQLLISSKLWESLSIPKEVKEVVIQDVSTSDMSGSILSEIELSIKDRYVSKRDLWMFQIRLLGSVVFRGFAPSFHNILRCSEVSVDRILGNDNQPVLHGLVGPQTRVIVRSNSAQICLIINITRELWSFDTVTREPVFSKVVQLVLRGIEDAQRTNKNHHLTICLSGRLAAATSKWIDLYEIIFEGALSDMKAKQFRSDMLKFFNEYPSAIKWKENPFFSETLNDTERIGWYSPLRSRKDPNLTFVRDTSFCECSANQESDLITISYLPSAATETNLLESINMCISHFGKHHLDRKLRVTGTQISFISFNSGVLKVTDPVLPELSRRRFAATACDIKLISVGPKPIVTHPFAIFCGPNNDRMDCPWISLNNFRSKFAVGTPPPAFFGVNHLGKTRRCLYKPPSMTSSLVPREKPIADPFFVNLDDRSKSFSDEDLISLGIVSPKLQRVAVEASIRASDVKPIDNWIVQGEGVKTLHDLIGIRLSLDMQMVDISGSEGLSGSDRVGSTPPLLSSTDLTGEPSSIISANAFGVKVARSSMRDTHIHKVLLKGGEERSMWMLKLNRLDSGNVYVSKVSLASPSLAAESSLAPPTLSMTYNYVLRRVGKRGQLSPVSSPRDVIVCDHCQSINGSETLQTRRFMTAQPMPWNVLDEIISNPFVQQSLPSSVPYNANPVPLELEGFRWKLRSSIRTALFCITPADSDFSHSLMHPSGISLGQDFVPSTSPVCSSKATKMASNFLDWLRKLEYILKVPGLSVGVLQEKQKRTQGFVSVIVNCNKTDCFKLHYEPHMQFPRPFIFSIEWILCHSAIIENVISEISKAAEECQNRIIALPHAQLFPPPLPGGISSKECLDELPFHSKFTINLPEWTKIAFYSLLISRLMDRMGMLLLFACKEEAVTEGIFLDGHGRPFCSREPGWILMSSDGKFFVEIKNTSIDWFRSHTAASLEDMEDSFLVFKQAVHTSLLDS